MPLSFFFYDLETTGISAARDRIMQFAGQRTDINLKKIGKPFNISISLTDDILPAPEAILLSGISPLDVEAKGISEAAFSDIFNEQIAKAGTIFCGFNNVRFDDEFIRYLNYRNFYDAFSWHWKDNSSRWDILDALRMTRALRPEGINWPFNEEGKPSNKLEFLTAANSLLHESAHDALSDALATIDVSRLLKEKQPKLFNYLLSIRSKQKLIELIESNKVLIYTSSHYSSEILHTTIVYVLDFDPDKSSALVYDLREDTRSLLDLSIEEMAELWSYDPEKPRPSLPIKTMKLNRCPAVAPVSVLDEASISRLKIDMKAIEKNQEVVAEHRLDFSEKLRSVTLLLDKNREERIKAQPRIPSADEKLYDGFVPKSDAYKFPKARQLAKKDHDFEISFEDKRLASLYSLYRARNYHFNLTPEEVTGWRQFVRDKLFSGEPSRYSYFVTEIEELKKTYKKDRPKLELLDGLRNYGLTILNDYGTDLPEPIGER